MPQEALATDFGEVIIQLSLNTDISFKGPNYLNAPEVFGACDALSNLHKERFGNNMYVISQCALERESRILEWSAHHHFFERTGISSDNFYFCRDITDKAPICKRLGVTHFVDDRLEVLQCLNSVSNLYLFNASSVEGDVVGIQPVRSWRQLLTELL